MANYQITLHIPQNVYERAQRIAEQTSQPVEQVLAAQLGGSPDVLSNLPVDEQAELATFRLLADDTLLGMVGEQMPPAISERMITLGDKTSRGLITPGEIAEYALLVERGNRLMLRKAWAANILTDRGHQISKSDFAPGNWMNP